MSLAERCLNALTGFVAFDLFQIVAEALNTKRRWKRGVAFVAPQTKQNVQNAALAAVLVAVDKDSEADYWRFGHQRMSELCIEEWFGRLRVQFPSAQMTCRSYYKAALRETLKRSAQEPECPGGEIKKPWQLTVSDPCTNF